MKILIISLFLPQKEATHAGGRYVFEMVKELSRRHEVYLATRVEEQELADIEELRPFCRAIHPFPYKTSARRGPLGTLRLICNYLGFSRFANKLITSERFDLVQVEWVEAAVLISAKQAVMVLDAHDVISKPAERRYRQATGAHRIAAYCSYRLMRILEARITARFDRIIVRSEVDSTYLRAIDPSLPLSLIPHPAGLDVTGITYERKKNSILFLASYKYRQTNVDAAKYFYNSVLPLVREKIPAAVFIIAGYGPPDELLSLEKQDPHCVVPGFVEDTDAYYKTASVFVAPILVGGGIIVKILDAMAAGAPVVTTSYGNEGIGAEPGRDILIADDAESFASQVVRVLQDRSFADKLGQSGQVYIRSHYGKEAIFSMLDSLHKQLLKDPGR